MKTVPLVQVVGFGPAALGLLIAADRNNYLAELLTEGIVFLDRRARDEWDGLFYHIRSNSSASDILCKIRKDGSFGSIINSNLAKLIRGYGDTTLPLTLASAFMKAMAMEADSIISKGSRSSILYKTEVSALILGDDGVVTSLNAKGEKILQSRYAVIATGAEEGVYIGRNDGGNSFHFRSGDIISGKEKGALGKLISEGREIIIVGGSHSAFSTVVWLLKVFGEHLHVGQIEVVHKGDIKLYYKNVDEASSHGVDLVAQNIFHPTNEVNKFDGLRGVAREMYSIIASGRENRVRFRKAEKNSSGDNEHGKIVISAIGYSPRNIVLYDERGETISLSDKHHNVRLTNNCNPITIDGLAVDNIFAIGLGHALEYNGQAKVGINFFHGEAADAILANMF